MTSSSASVSLSNLRAVVIIIVVAFHSALPYLASQPPHPFPFDEVPYRWVAFPIIDRERWFGFDLFCAWQDVSLMSLMFFLAGLLAPASLNRKGSLVYLRDRWWRIAVPFLFAVAILSPLAYFASYRTTAADPSVTAFWQHWRALPMWPSGPQWFLWQLFLLSALAAGLHAIAPRSLASLGQLVKRFGDRPLGFVVALVLASFAAYVPLAMAFSAWDWTYLGPFSFQLSRPLHYAVYFFAGFAIGGYGCDRGILRYDGPLVRRWPLLLAAALISFGAWGGLTSLTLPDWNASSVAYRFLAASAFPVACATGVLCLLAVSLRLMRWRDRILDTLSVNAYGIYLVHYCFVLWLQYALLPFDLDAIAKATLVFACALALSWAASATVGMLGSRQVGTARQAIAHRPQ
ncbi:acyltransferase [Bradyrhizobium sp. CB82]|uniref:acyltransferase family protein n=1 Tax=Bradyrhizobium sp. CB82 TaxID=3039159 RepID=UPI0024B1D471|nr:acyltransferase [Bradyrhizobium sp. CB82]WFU41770.1 acyltransferase [Bradyrhizobium sp. CB82]